MNILHITLGLGRGGIERLICDLSQVQIHQGHHVRVLTVRGGGDLDQELRQAGAIVDCYGIRKEHWRRQILPWCLWLRGYLRRCKIDAVIEHVGLHGYVSWACASVAVPYMVVVIHNTYQRGFFRRLQHRFYNRIFLNRYSHLIAVSESVRKHDVNNFGVPSDRIKVIHNGIVIDRFKLPVPTLKEKSQLLGATLEEDEIIVGTVGMLRPQKNHELMLRAWAKLVSKCSVPLKLIIVGGGYERENLEKQRDSLGLTDSVFFLGTRTDVPSLLKCFDILLMSSKYEGHPVGTLEAMASGLPVVATRVAGLRDVIQDGINGFLVEPENPEALVEGLEKLIFNVDLRGSMGRAGQRFVEEHFSIQQCARLYEKQLLESPLNGHNKFMRR